MIRIYSGSNWVLEEHESSSKSYIYLDQIIIESNDLVITFHTKIMPPDWVGSELLEVSTVPYKMIKSDTMGTLEMIGEWMRFTKNSDNEIEYNIESLNTEYINIKKWINHTSNHQKTTTNLDPQKVQLNFQEFLIKYSLPANHSNYILGSCK